MTNPMVSIVMSVLNGERFLAEAVESVLNQSFSDLEAIVVNDGSTDRSGEILESIRETDSRLQIIHQENKGLVESLNRACALVRGKYIARLGADDIATRDRMKLQVDFMEKNPEVSVLAGAVEVIDASGKSLYFGSNPIDRDEVKAALVRGECPLWDTTVIMRTDVFQSVGGYRKLAVYSEDYDLFLRMSDHYQLANLATVLGKYRLHSGQVTVRKCKQSAMSGLAAKAAAVLRRNGNPDPLDSVTEITPALLAGLGVSEAAMNDALAKHYLRAIQILCDNGDYPAASEALEDMSQSCKWKESEGRAVGDLHLLWARTNWHKGKYGTSILDFLRAVSVRPVILGRPLKQLFRHFHFSRQTSEVRGSNLAI